MDLPIDVLKIILYPIIEKIPINKFYNLRLVSKDFKNVIDKYDKGFYISLRNIIGFRNNAYEILINEKLRKSYINLKLGLKILELDDWVINTNNTSLKELCYPKWEKNNNIWTYTLKSDANKYIKKNKEIIKISNLNYEYEYDINNMSDYEVECNILEKYKNEMEKLFIIFKKIKNKNTIQWLKQNGELD